jgi:hypothetical protein
MKNFRTGCGNWRQHEKKLLPKAGNCGMLCSVALLANKAHIFEKITPQFIAGSEPRRTPGIGSGAMGTSLSSLKQQFPRFQHEIQISYKRCVERIE